MNTFSVQSPVAKQYVLEKEDGSEFIIFSESPLIHIEFYDLNSDFHLKWINPLAGKTGGDTWSETDAQTMTLEAPFEGSSQVWLRVNK